MIEYLLVVLTAEQMFGKIWCEGRFYETESVALNMLVVSL